MDLEYIPCVDEIRQAVGDLPEDDPCRTLALVSPLKRTRKRGDEQQSPPKRCRRCSQDAWTVGGSCFGGCEWQQHMRSQEFFTWRSMDKQQVADRFEDDTATMVLDMGIEGLLQPMKLDMRMYNEGKRGQLLLSTGTVPHFDLETVMEPLSDQQDAGLAIDLRENGYAVVPLRVDMRYMHFVDTWMQTDYVKWAPELADEVRCDFAKLDHEWEHTYPMSLGPFIATPSCFHAPTVREMRIVFHKRMRALLKHVGSGCMVEQIPGAYMMRKKGQAGVGIPTHHTGVFSAAINIGVHDSHTLEINKDTRVVVPPGNMLVFTNKVTVRTVKSRHDTNILFAHMALRRDDALLPLTDPAFMDEGAVPEPQYPMYTKAHALDKTFNAIPGHQYNGVRQWSKIFHPNCIDHTTGLVHRHMPSLKELGFYTPKYTDAETAMFCPMKL